MFVQHLRLAARKALRRPGLTLVTFLTLVLGIAVSASIFTVAWAILVRPFPFANEDRLIQLWAHDAKGGIDKFELSFEEIAQMEKEATTFDGLAAFSAANFSIVLNRGDQPMNLVANVVGESFFRTLGVKPMLGRSFTAAEHAPGAPFSSIMLSHAAWQEWFGGDPAIVGQTLKGRDGTVQVIGILPRHFDLPAGAEVICALDGIPADAENRANRTLTAVARMKPGVTIDDVSREVGVIATHVTRMETDAEKGVTLIPYPLTAEILGTTSHAVRILFGMGLLVLVIALLNTASIALAQGVGRLDELGVRTAVGATRWATALQLFAELLAIALVAAIVAIALATFFLPLLLQMAPATIPRIGEVRIGIETVIFAFAAAIVSALLGAGVQLLATSETDGLRALRAASKATSGRRTRHLLELIAGGQVAVAIVTLVVASLLIQSFRRYADIDVGFSTGNVITFHLPRGYTVRDEPEKKRAFFRDLMQRIRAIDGVEAAGSVLIRPLQLEQGWDLPHSAEGQSVGQHLLNPIANLLTVTPGYLEAMNIELLRGRTLTDDDREDSPLVTVVSESFARRHWSIDDAVGKRIKGGRPDSERPWLTVVGVVSDVRYRSLTTEKLDVYVPVTQSIWSPNYVAVRTRQNPELILPAVRRIVAQLDPETPVSAVRTTRQLVDAKLAQPRLSAVIVAIFAATATLLALVGLYGVLAYGVRQRTAEMGVRLALGATSGSLISLIARRALIIAIAGAAAGIAVSIGTSRLWSSFAYGVDGIELRPTALLSIGFAIAAVAASLVPAFRATRVNPVAALRSER